MQQEPLHVYNRIQDVIEHLENCERSLAATVISVEKKSPYLGEVYTELRNMLSLLIQETKDQEINTLILKLKNPTRLTKTNYYEN